MSLKEIQKNKALVKLLKEELESGVVPSEETLRYKLDTYFKENPPGKSIYKPKQVEKYLKMSSEDYNRQLSEILNDLENIYLSLTEQNMNVTDNFIYSERVRGEILDRIKNLTLYCNNLIKKQESKGSFAKSIKESFYDLTNINENQSTTFIDFDSNKVTLKPKLYKLKKIDLNNSNIYINSTGPEKISEKIDTLNINDLDNCLNDYLNSSWIEKLIINAKKENNQEIDNVFIELIVSMESTNTISKIDLTSNTKELKKVNMEVYDVENEEFINVTHENNEFYDKDIWNFDPIKTNKLKIKLTKNMILSEKVQEVIFSLKDISVFMNEYEKNGKIETNIYDVELGANETIEKIELEAEDLVPEGTTLNYYIDLFDKEDNPVKQDMSINPHTDDNYIKLNNVNENKLLMSHKDMIKASEHNNYNVKYYMANYKLSPLTIDKETLIYKGINMWKREIFQFNHMESHDVSMGDWGNKPVLEESVLTDYVTELDNKITEYIEYDKKKSSYPLKLSYIDEDTLEVFYYNQNGVYKVSESDYSIKTVEYNIDGSDYNDLDIKRKYIVEINKELNDNSVYFVKYYADYVNYKFTTYINMDHEEGFKTKEFDYNNDMESFRKLYINNFLVPINQSGPNNFLYKGNFDEGWNKVVYIAYNENSKQNIISKNNSYVKNFLKFNQPKPEALTTETSEDLFASAVSRIRSGGSEDSLSNNTYDNNDDKIDCKNFRAEKEPMKYVSYYDMINRILKDEKMFFTLYRNFIILNDPAMCNYKVNYLTLTNEINRIRLKAELATNRKHVSPFINELTLNFFYRDGDSSND